MATGSPKTLVGHCEEIWAFLTSAATVKWTPEKLTEQQSVIQVQLALTDTAFDKFCLELGQSRSIAHFQANSPIYTRAEQRGIVLAQTLKRLQREFKDIALTSKTQDQETQTDQREFCWPQRMTCSQCGVKVSTTTGTPSPSKE